MPGARRDPLHTTVVVGSEEVVDREFRAFADAGVTDLVVVPLDAEPERVLTVARDVRGRPAAVPLTS